ncbi:MAG: NADH-dependent phenylglyoxylate dehydrogenase subunit gamma [Firmicutes bacterium ADurb.Bin182]|nr:MAG: NADH-dependent phenylglyoxylate dehydrogenase subunit gamma [Firmicutes bacterium ADurb.Bin182]
MLEQNIFAGFGGQGVLLMGQLLAYAGMLEDKHVSWLPSYGPEMRGGTANCSVVISDRPVASPIVTKASSVVVMNRPSLDKFESFVQPGGTIFINSSIIDKKAERDDISAFYVECNKIAEELGNPKVANMVMLGAFIQKTGCVDFENVLKAILNKLGEQKANLIPLNREALKRGAACISQS